MDRRAWNVMRVGLLAAALTAAACGPDRQAPAQLEPATVVVLGDGLDAVEPLRALPAGAEVFARWVPGAGAISSAPPRGATSRPETGARVYSRDYTSTAVPARAAAQVADDIIALHDRYLHRHGLHLQRWIPGHAPDIEWGAVEPWDEVKWRDINAYYSDIKLYLDERKGSRDIELYTPALSLFAAVGVTRYHPDGSVVMHPSGFVGLDYCRQMVDLYKKLTWHSDSSPGLARSEQVRRLFPAWLRARVSSWGYPARVTGAGWRPGPDRQIRETRARRPGPRARPSRT